MGTPRVEEHSSEKDIKCFDRESDVRGMNNRYRRAVTQQMTEPSQSSQVISNHKPNPRFFLPAFLLCNDGWVLRCIEDLLQMTVTLYAVMH